MPFLRLSPDISRLALILTIVLLLGEISRGEPPKPADAEREAGSIPVLDPVFVTATRTELPLREVPSTAGSVTAERMQQRQVATTPDALREIPGVMIQKTSVGQGSPFIRGFTGFRTLMLIDGVRLNNSTFREGPNQYWNTIDSFSLDRIEVVKGQGSVLYGSDAIGGTAQAITKPALPADAAAEGTAFLNADTQFRYATASDSKAARAEANFGRADLWGLRLGATGKWFGDVRAADLGTLPYTGYDEWDLDAKFTLRISPDWTATAAYQRVEQEDAWRTHRTIYSRSWEGTSVGSELRHLFDQERQLAYVRLEGRDMTGWVEDASLTFSWQRQAEARDRIVATRARDIEEVRTDTFGVALQLKSPLPWGPLAWGADYYEDHVDSSKVQFKPDGSFDRRRIQGPVADDATYRTAGIFAEQEIRASETLSLFAGARYSYAEADAGRVELPGVAGASRVTGDWGQLVGSARFLWEALEDDRLQIYGGASQGFRAPNLSDLTRLDIARSNEMEIPSPGLDPEQFLTLELGSRSAIGDWKLGGAFYYTFIHDMIIRRPTGQEIDGSTAVAKSNAGEGYLYGFELEASYQPHADWIIFGNLAWNDGRVDSFPTSDPVMVEEPISRLLPLTALLGVRWEPEGRPYWAELSAQAAAEQDRLNAGDRSDSQRIPPGGTPGYAVVNLRGGYRIGDAVEIIASLENLTDTDYRIHGSGQNEAGFGATFSVVAKF